MKSRPGRLRRPRAARASAPARRPYRVEVAPITIYAKLDANVRLQLDEDVKALIQKNPNLF